MTAAPLPDATSLVQARLRLWLKLLKASGMIEEEVRRRLRGDCDTTLPRFDVMAALSRAPEGLKMSEISRLLRVSNGNITGIVDKLAEEGLVERVAVPDDRRANRVQMTQKGTAVFAGLAAAHAGWIDALLGDLHPREIEEMSRQLTKLVRSLEERR